MASSRSQNTDSTKDTRKLRKKARNNNADNEGSTLPGVQKLKASLRQTRRLLAKDTLSADIRAETERRLRSLEADLRTAEQKRKERAMAVKYHKVKFFERRKALRKIKQTKRELNTTASSTSSPKASTSRLENSLFESRVDLNYILRYPKLEKYISLYPPTPSEETQDEPTSGTAPDSGATDTRREEIRALVRAKMESGEFPMEPELELEGVSGDEDRLESRKVANKNTILAGKSKDSRRLWSTANSRGDEGDAWDSLKSQVKVRKEVDTKRKHTDPIERDRYEDDDFFDHCSDSNSTNSDE